MLNQVILVGRIVEKVKKVKGVASIKVEVERNYGEGSNTIKIILPEGLADSVKEYCSVGTTIGFKAHIHAEPKARYGTVTTIVADKATFINASR